MAVNLTTCFLCTNSAIAKCEECDFGHYCSKDHYNLHKSANGDCLPFLMKYKDGIGRYLQATRNVKAFDIILEDTDIAWGPIDGNTLVRCLACLETIDFDINSKCKDCNLPLCNKTECLTSPVHRPECQILRHHQPEKLEITGPGHPVYALIVPLRIFQLRHAAVVMTVMEAQ